MKKVAMMAVVAALVLTAGFGVFAFAHGPNVRVGGNGYGAYNGWMCPWMSPGYVPRGSNQQGVWYCPWMNGNYAPRQGGWFCPWQGAGYAPVPQQGTNGATPNQPANTLPN